MLSEMSQTIWRPVANSRVRRLEKTLNHDHGVVILVRTAQAEKKQSLTSTQSQSLRIPHSKAQQATIAVELKPAEHHNILSQLHASPRSQWHPGKGREVREEAMQNAKAARLAPSRFMITSSSQAEFSAGKKHNEAQQSEHLKMNARPMQEPWEPWKEISTSQRRFAAKTASGQERSE